MDRLSWKWVWFLAILPILGFWITGLTDLDEGFYAAVVSEMLRTGDWITPHYNGSPWFEKPILLYWLAAPTVAMFGETIGPRLPSVLSSLGTLNVVVWFCCRHFGEACAKWAVLILASSLLFAGAGRLMLADPILNLCLSGSYLLFYESLVRNPKFRIPAAVLLGFTMLAKGPFAAILFVPLAIITYFKSDDLRPGFAGQWGLSVMAFVAVVSTWYLPAYLINGQLFVQKFFIEQNISRLSGGDEAHRVGGIFGWVFYLVVILILMLPWSLSIPAAIARRDGSSKERSLHTYLVTWAALILILFTFSGSKLPHYILPAFPPLAILIAVHLSRTKSATRTPVVAMVMPVLAFVILNLAQYADYYGLGSSYFGSGQAELHRLIHSMRDQPGRLFAFQLPRRQKSKGTGELKLQETSRPSITFYSRRTIQEVENPEELKDMKSGDWLITRTGRLKATDLTNLNPNLKLISDPTQTRAYELYQVKQ